MQNDCTTVDELIAEIADDKSSYQDVAVTKLHQLCEQSYEAYHHLCFRMLDVWLPEHARKRLSDVMMTVGIELRAFQERERTNLIA